MLFKALFVNLDTGFYNVGTGKAVTLQKQIEGIIEEKTPKTDQNYILF